MWLNTRDGRRVLDLYGGHAVAALGYGHPGWTRALAEQARSCQFQSNAVPMDVRLRAAERLVRFAGLGLDTVFFINSGAEANENALKMAFRMTGRSQVVALEQGFSWAHGRGRRHHLGRGQDLVWLSARPVRCEVHVAYRYCGARSCHHRADTAAVVVEPVQGVGGAFDLGAPFLAAVRARCDATGAVLIFDEVQCGVGRTGHPFAANLYGVTPRHDHHRPRP